MRAAAVGPSARRSTASGAPSGRRAASRDERRRRRLQESLRHAGGGGCRPRCPSRARERTSTRVPWSPAGGPRQEASPYRRVPRTRARASRPLPSEVVPSPHTSRDCICPLSPGRARLCPNAEPVAVTAGPQPAPQSWEEVRGGEHDGSPLHVKDAAAVHRPCGPGKAVDVDQDRVSHRVGDGCRGRKSGPTTPVEGQHTPDRPGPMCLASQRMLHNSKALVNGDVAVSRTLMVLRRHRSAPGNGVASPQARA